MKIRLGFKYLFTLTLLLSTAWNARAGSGTFTTYEVHLQNSLTQTGLSSFVPGIPNGTDQFSIVASVDTAGASLSAAPILGLPAPTQDIPSGSVTFPTGPNFSPLWHTGKGYNEYHWGDGYTTAAELNSVYGSGTFTFTLGDATAMPTLSLNTVNPTYPISPILISGGTWSGGDLLIDATTGVTLTFNASSFTDYSNGAWLGAQIKFELVDSSLMPISTPALSQYFPSLGKTDPALTSFTIAPGALVAGQTYIFQANYNVYGEINTTSFTGTGITGNPVGFSGYLTSTFITIKAITELPTGSLNTARARHTATLLQNGKVLVAGGLDSSNIPSASAELYDLASGTWTPTGSLSTARFQHTATLLPNGKVLIAGGRNSSNNDSATAELYDPASGSWTATGNLNTARDRHTATLLPNGKVLVAGGVDSTGNASTSAELYDPATETWAATGSLNSARHTHTATLLSNGKVLIAGGNDNINFLTSAELYNPASGTWAATGSLNSARARHTATLLPNNVVLVAGGLDSSNNASTSAELYDPASGTTWTATGNLNTARDFHTATLLPNGMVLVAGGLDSSNNAVSSAERYDPVSGAWTTAESINIARGRHTATLLSNGMVLIAGGVDSSGVALASAELYITFPQLTSAVSRMTHGSAGTFDINLPFVGTPGVECRSGGTGGNYSVVFTFVNEITDCGSAATNGGTLISGPNTNQCTENLTGVPNAQYINVMLNNVVDTQSNSGNIAVSMGVLVGDTTANGTVNSSDIAQTQSQSGQPVTANNFREDVTVNGAINSSDIGLVQSKSGTALPTPPSPSGSATSPIAAPTIPASVDSRVSKPSTSKSKVLTAVWNSARRQ